MSQDNTVFTGGEPTWANACVGNNGSPGYWDYAKGFSQAAIILIDTVLSTRGAVHSVDEIVYPVCFNMRHSVELRLKGAISELIMIVHRKEDILRFDLEGSHDIGNIWEFFVKESKKLDERYEVIIERLDNKIRDIARVDATGQTFRYPLDTESRKHLIDVAIINFITLKQSFEMLEGALDELHEFNKYLAHEYACGTFTGKLSRKNIFEIASLLPCRSTWTGGSFDNVKDKIKHRFGIGSNELSRSINFIKEHYEFAPLIGMSVPLLGLDERDMDEFFHHWFKRHDVISDTELIDFESRILNSGDILQSMMKNAKEKEDVWKVFKEKIRACK